MSKPHTRYTQDADAEPLIALANNVQTALTASGSLQQIGPLSQADIQQACANRHCFVIEDPRSEAILGCAFVKLLSNDAEVSYELGPRGMVTISSCPRPWLYLHTVMLQPSSQGRGIGAQLVDDLVRVLEEQHVQMGGTMLLNCWAGNDKLRVFYANAGFIFLAVVPKKDSEIAVFHKQLTRRC